MDDSPGQMTVSAAEHAALKSRHERLVVLHQVSLTIHSTLDPQRALELIMEEAARITRASSGSVVLVNPNTGFLEIQVSHGLPPNSDQLRLRVGEGITGWVARAGVAARVGNVEEDDRYIAVKGNVRSELAVPLRVGGEVRGVLNVDSDRPDAFTGEDESLLRDLATLAAKVIENTWVYEQVRQKARLLESLINVAQTLNSTLHLDEALAVITREAGSLMGASMSSILMLDETGEWLDLRASHGAGKAYINKPRLSASESLLGSVVRRRKAIHVENVQASSRYQHVEVARGEGLVSLLSVPLVFGGKAIGALNVYTSTPHHFSNEEVKVLSVLGDLSGIAIEKAKLYERIVDIEEQLRTNEKLSALGLLAAEVAHEIRNPLTVIKMLYHSLDLNFPPDDPRSRDVEIIRQRMDHLNKIVEQILDFARTSDPVLAPVDVNKLLDDLLLLTRHKMTHLRIHLVRKFDPGLPHAMGDATQMGQVFLNLTLNAMEAMPQGGTLTLMTRLVTLSRAGEPWRAVVIEIGDTGAGMSEEQRRAAFTSFLNTTKARGTGLGLAIVGKIMEAHGAKVKILSKPGGGTRFRLFFRAGD